MLTVCDAIGCLILPKWCRNNCSFLESSHYCLVPFPSRFPLYTKNSSCDACQNKFNFSRVEFFFIFEQNWVTRIFRRKKEISLVYMYYVCIHVLLLKVAEHKSSRNIPDLIKLREEFNWLWQHLVML